jgi:uncharacterized protein YoxC
LIAAATLSIAHFHPALLALALAAPDTVVAVSAPAEGFARLVTTLQSIASLVIALALIAIAVPLIPAAWNSRKMYKRINEIIERFRSDVDPVVKHAVAVADNLDYISTSVRVDVQQLNQTIAATNRRLNHAAAMAEQRLNEFNALLQVVQEEAESLFIGTASTIRGVQAGAESFRAFREPDDDWTDEELERYSDRGGLDVETGDDDRDAGRPFRG